MNSTMKNRVIRALSPLGVRSRMLVAVVLAGAIVTACDVHGVSEPGTLATISVSPNATLASTATIQMVAVGRDADGRVIPISPTWSVSGIVGAVNATGMFTAGPTVGVFNNSVIASVGNISGSASMTITAGVIATITVVPSPVTLAVTATQQFIAVAKDAGGNIVQFTPTWSVVAGGGSIDATGNFTAGGAPGTYTNTVQASNNGTKGFATVIVTLGPVASITVTPNPDTLIVGAKQQFVATGKDASGNVVVLAAVWSVVANGGTVDVNGMFTAGATPGTFTNTVKATSGSLSGTATVVVTVGPLASIKVTPNPDTLAINGAQQFTATGSDAAGNPVVITPVWAVVAGGGTITATGLFTAGTISGTFTNTVQATSGALTGFATVVVKSGALASMTVTPNPANMFTNSTQQFAAVGKDANGNTVPLVPVWQVVNGGGVIDALGMFTSGNVAGTFTNTVQATSGLLTGLATVIVNAVVPPPPPPPVSPLGTAANFGILAGTGITCAISGTINSASTPSNIGSSPTLTISGFPPCTFTGIIPTPAVVAVAKGDLTAAYLAAQAQVCNLNLSGIDLGFYDGSSGAKTLPPGTYCFNTSAAITGTLKLTGSAVQKWTFQVGSTFNNNVGSQVLLAGGAIADNVYWAVGSSATLLTNSATQGNIMSLASITLQNGATLLGRALAQTGAVDMTAGAATITKP
jgi:Ice-binding-like